MSIVVSADPQDRPVALHDLKTHARILGNEEDDWLDLAIDAAVKHTETEINLKLIDQTVTWKLDWWLPCRLIFPVGPLRSVTSIQYVDGDGATQTLASDQYIVDAAHDPGRVFPAYDVVWPTPRRQENAVTIVYVAGFGTEPGSVPTPLRHAILLLAAHFYEHREAYLNTNFGMVEVPRGYAALIYPYRNWLI